MSADTPSAGPAPTVPSAPDRPARVRVHMGELLSAGSGLVLLISLFAVKWYGVAGVPDPSYARPAVSSAVDGWNALTGTRWWILATIVVSVGTIVLHVSQLQHGVKTDTSPVVTAVAGVTVVLLVYRVMIVLPSGDKVIDQKLGAFIGLAAALGVLWGGCESLAERRRRPEPLHHRSRPPGRRAPRLPRARRAAEAGEGDDLGVGPDAAERQ